jgi:hypothetical protein
MSVVGSRYQATINEELEEIVCAVVTVIFVVCNSVRLIVICSYVL